MSLSTQSLALVLATKTNTKNKTNNTKTCTNILDYSYTVPPDTAKRAPL